MLRGKQGGFVLVIVLVIAGLLAYLCFEAHEAVTLEKVLFNQATKSI